MTPELKDFYGRIKLGPTFLYLGQRYLKLESGTDAFLSELVRKYGRAEKPTPDNYDQILDNDASAAPETALAWMHERSKRISVPAWLRIVSSFQWSGVYTSAIDAIWFHAFRNSWRQIQPVLEEKYKPLDPRNRLNLHCTFLFGCVDRSEVAQRPPLTRFEWRKRKQIAVSLAKRLPESVTPKGVLVIEGYSDDDWLAPEELFPILDELDPGQVHVFSASESLSNHPDVKELVKRGKVFLYPSGLASTLTAGEQLGFIKLGLPAEEEHAGRRIRLDDQTLVVPHDIWVQTVRSANILDDTVLINPPTLSPEGRYREFRTFLSGANGRPPWMAFAKGLAFRRHFEKNLWNETRQRLEQKRLSETPVILHGQTGTGKTVALASLAYSIRKELKYPVLFIERRLQKPLQADIDRFCKWAEDSGASACLVVWDGMVGLDEYFELLRYLTGRGRKVVLVGSCYRLVDKPAEKSNFVLAPAELSAPEVSEFSSFLTSFDPSIESVLARVPPFDDSFLVALYRLLPETRGSIRGGVSTEATHTEQRVVDRAQEVSLRVPAKTALQEALMKAGVTAGLLTQPVEVAGETVSEIQDFTGLVMVPGQFGLSVPLELLMRSWGMEAHWHLPQLFEVTDFFKWYEDSVGNIEVGPRNSLEAQLVIGARMGGARMEIEYIKRLLLEIRESGGSPIEDREVSFAVELIRWSAKVSYYIPFFRDLSETLRQLREQRGIENPRLMLPEAFLLREWAINQDRQGVIDVAIDEAFGRAEPILQKALSLVENDGKNKRLSTFLIVELAADLASQARHKRNAPNEALELFQRTRDAVHRARLLDYSNYHAIDILAWASRDVLKLDALNEGTRAEILADVLHTLQSTDPSAFDPMQREDFEKRRLEFAQLYNLKDMAEDAFTALAEQGSSAGYYLRALSLSGLAGSQVLADGPDYAKIGEALKYLDEHKRQISRDVRCLDLYLDLWWRVNTKSRIFDRERATVGLTPVQWQSFLEIVLALESTGESTRPAILGFLRGLALFHLGSVPQAFEVFRNVERDSDQVLGRRRIIRSYLASTPTGAPRKFYGTVSRIYAEGRRGEVYVEDLRLRVQFIPHEFQKPDLKPNDTLGEFHIAFNFLGPIADPLAYHKG